MADMLGLDDQTKAEKATPDFLGNPAVTSFRGQPSLPSHIGAPASAASTGPQTIAGSGTAAVPPGVPPSFGDLANMVIPEQGGAGGTGPGSGEGGSLSPSVAGQGQFTDLNLSLGPVSISPTGNVSLRTGNTLADTALNFGIGKGLGAAGLSTNILGTIAQLAQSPMMGAVASAFNVAGIPLTLANIAHAIASMSPNSVASLQSALNQGLVENMDQIAAVLAGAAQGPQFGGPQPIGILAMDNPVSSPAVNSTPSPSGTFGGPNSAPATLSDITLSPTFAALANAITGRGDQPDAGPTGPGPGGVGPGAGQGGPTGSDVGESGGSASEG